jgi:hypothetical protein
MRSLLIRYKYKSKISQLQIKYNNLLEEFDIVNESNTILAKKIDEVERSVIKYNYYLANSLLIIFLGIMSYIFF